MKIRILGAHNMESLHTRLACVLLDGTIALDAGAITSTLTMVQQNKIKAVLLTHRHYDHVRDLLTLGMNMTTSTTTAIYSKKEVLDSIREYYVNGQLYPDFTRPRDGVIRYNLVPMKNGRSFKMFTYEVTGLDVQHSVPAMGYLVSKDGSSFFFSGDCSGGLAQTLKGRPVNVLFTEVTYADEKIEVATRHGHMTPAILAEQLLDMDPRPARVVVLHMVPAMESRIREELAQVGEATGVDISLGHEGQLITI